MPDYMENDGPAQETPMQESSGGGDGMDKGEGEGQTFLINKEAYPEAKPGDTFKMRVEQVHDQEMECSVMKEGEAKDEGSAEEASPPAASMPDGMMD